MTRYLLLAAALCACSGKSDRADSVDAAVPAIDTLKPVTARDTAQAQTQPRSRTAPRDSAFSPPRKLRRLDTLKKSRPI